MIKVCKSQIVVAQVVHTILTHLTVEWVFITGSLIQSFWHFQAFILLARQPSQQIELNGAERHESHWLNEKHPGVHVPIGRLISEQILRSVFLTELPRCLGLCAAISTRGLRNVDKLYFWCYISCPLRGLLFRKFSFYSSCPTVNRDISLCRHPPRVHIWLLTASWTLQGQTQLDIARPVMWISCYITEHVTLVMNQHVVRLMFTHLICPRGRQRRIKIENH